MRTNTLREDPELRRLGNTETEVINVSPFNAPVEIDGTPGSPPRRYMLKPGERVPIPSGYAHPFLSPTRQEVQPTIERKTMREAWPGKRREIAGGGFEWDIHPGPRLPMVVRLERAEEVRAQWDAAMEQRRAAQAGPLKLTLKRADGTTAEAELAVAEPEPKFRDLSSSKAAAPRGDEVEDLAAGPFDPDPDADHTVSLAAADLATTARATEKPAPKKGR